MKVKTPQSLKTFLTPMSLSDTRCSPSSYHHPWKSWSSLQLFIRINKFIILLTMCFLQDLWIILAASSLSTTFFLAGSSESAVLARCWTPPVGDNPPSVVGGGGLGNTGLSNIKRHHLWIRVAQNSVYDISLHNGPCCATVFSQYSLYLFFVIGKALVGIWLPCENLTRHVSVIKITIENSSLAT